MLHLWHVCNVLEGFHFNHLKHFLLFFIPHASYILLSWLQWTYCISVAMVIGAAVWFYLLTPSSKAQAYAPTILSGIGMSAAFVMALAFLTDLIGDNKVCNIALYLTFWLTFWLPLVVLTLLNFSQMVTFLIPVSGNFELLCVTQYMLRTLRVFRYEYRET